MAGNTGVRIFAGIALAASAAVGLARQVAWGRFLFSVISVLGAFAMPGVFAPSIHDEVGTTLLETVFGGYPAVWVAWMITMVAVLICLLPATIIGIDKDWFRDEKW